MTGTTIMMNGLGFAVGLNEGKRGMKDGLAVFNFHLEGDYRALSKPSYTNYLSKNGEIQDVKILIKNAIANLLSVSCKDILNLEIKENRKSMRGGTIGKYGHIENYEIEFHVYGGNENSYFSGLVTDCGVIRQ